LKIWSVGQGGVPLAQSQPVATGSSLSLAFNPVDLQRFPTFWYPCNVISRTPDGKLTKTRIQAVTEKGGSAPPSLN